MSSLHHILCTKKVILFLLYRNRHFIRISRLKFVEFKNISTDTPEVGILKKDTILCVEKLQLQDITCTRLDTNFSFEPVQLDISQVSAVNERDIELNTRR